MLGKHCEISVFVTEGMLGFVSAWQWGLWVSCFDGGEENTHFCAEMNKAVLNKQAQVTNAGLKGKNKCV